MKQTAVEWLDEQIEYILIQIIDGFLTIKEFMEEREKLFKQAKEIEKEQIMDAYKTFLDTTLPNKVYEEYYNETFKNK